VRKSLIAVTLLSGSEYRAKEGSVVHIELTGQRRFVRVEMATEVMVVPMARVAYWLEAPIVIEEGDG
jgi:hypothetical protein